MKTLLNRLRTKILGRLLVAALNCRHKPRLCKTDQDSLSAKHYYIVIITDFCWPLLARREPPPPLHPRPDSRARPDAPPGPPHPALPLTGSVGGVGGGRAGWGGANSASDSARESGVVGGGGVWWGGDPIDYLCWPRAAGKSDPVTITV